MKTRILMRNAKKVVSANYRNREDYINRWLVRGKKDKIDKARPAKNIYATRVVFRPSGAESGFGCSIVGFAETATVGGAVPKKVLTSVFPIKFDFDTFYNKVSGEKVTKCEHLILRPDGSMWGANLVAA
jgi:hypothetical protein